MHVSEQHRLPRGSSIDNNGESILKFCKFPTNFCFYFVWLTAWALTLQYCAPLVIVISSSSSSSLPLGFTTHHSVISNLKYLPNLIPLAFVKETPPSLNEIFKLWTKTLSLLDVEQIKEIRWIYWIYQFCVGCLE